MSVLARATVILGADITALNRELSQAEQNVAAAGNRIASIGRKFSARVTLPLTIAGTIAFKEFAEQIEAMEKVRAIVDATGGSAGVTAGHIEALGESLQQTTTFADDVTESAAAILLTFQNVRNEVGAGNDIFDRTIRLAQGMATVLGTDLQTAVRQLGIALEDPAAGMTLLRRAGVVFSAQQKRVIKDLFESGKVLESQRVLLDAVAEGYGTAAARMAQTPLGQVKQAWNELGDAMEDVGQVIADAVLPVVNGLKALAKAFKALDPDAKRLVVLAATAAAAFGPLLATFGAIVVALPALGAAMAGLAVPVGLALAALALLVNAGILVVKNWLWIKMQVVLLKQAIADAFVGMDLAVLNFVRDALHSLDLFLEGLAQIPSVLAPGIGALAGLARKAIAPMVGALDALTKEYEAGLEGMQASTGRVIAEIQAEMDEAERRGDEAANKRLQAELAAARARRGQKDPPPWVAKLVEISGELSKELAFAARMEEALGVSFDLAAAKVKIYEKAIEDAVKAGVPLADPRLQAWLKALQDAQVPDWPERMTVTTKELAEALDFARRMEAALGGEFDEAEARAAALQKAIEDAIANKTPLADPQLQSWIKQLQSVQTQIRVSALVWEIELARMVEAIEKAQDPTKAYEAAIAELQAQVAVGAITWEHYVEAVERAKEAMKSASDRAKELGEQVKQGLVDTIGRAIDDFVDNLFDMQKSFGEIIRQMIIDISKLIIKLIIMRELTKAFGLGGGGSTVPGLQHGGFLPSGRVALVGEAGPELVSAGRGGVTVTPMPAMRAESPGGVGRITVPVEVNVRAIDSKDSARFFEENEGAVANAVTRALQRSLALQRLITR